jgi:DNA transformation protein
VSAAFVDFVVDQLAGLGVTARRLFGGVGLYAEGAMLGFIYGERVYLKVGAANRAAFDAAKAPALIYAPDKKAQVIGSLRELPLDVLDDSDAAVRWAEGALAAARAKT